MVLNTKLAKKSSIFNKKQVKQLNISDYLQKPCHNWREFLCNQKKSAV